jgi:hypothetical protein
MGYVSLCDKYGMRTTLESASVLGAVFFAAASTIKGESGHALAAATIAGAGSGVFIGWWGGFAAEFVSSAALASCRVGLTKGSRIAQASQIAAFTLVTGLMCSAWFNREAKAELPVSEPPARAGEVHSSGLSAGQKHLFWPGPA